MPCPYFEPDRPLPSHHWVRPPRFPLLEAYAGACRSQAPGVAQPDVEHQGQVCNFGYPAGRCQHWPDGGIDAVRFTVLARDLHSVRILYVREKDHSPLQHGNLVYSLREGVFLAAPEGEPSTLLLAQAGAFVRTYLKQQATA